MLAYEAKQISDSVGLLHKAMEQALVLIERVAKQGRTSVTVSVTKETIDDLAVKLAEMGYAVTMCGTVLLIDWGNADGSIRN